ncbi:MAG: hypothetical protein KC636_34005 [Myxococcales bacterium]|nr:hypothetical protein [Myxococcales bacterium]
MRRHPYRRALLVALLLVGCRGDYSDLCEHITAVEAAERGSERANAKDRCSTKVHQRKLDAGVLRWPGVRRCALAAESSEAIEACWIDEKNES